MCTTHSAALNNIVMLLVLLIARGSLWLTYPLPSFRTAVAWLATGPCDTLIGKSTSSMSRTALLSIAIAHRQRPRWGLWTHVSVCWYMSLA